MGCGKADMQVLPMLEGVKRGYAVVAVNYRLSWEAKFPALVHDAKAAVRWIRANARGYGFDPERIAVWGGSAGGYLVSMLGTSAGVPELEDLSLGNPEQPGHVQVVVERHRCRHSIIAEADRPIWRWPPPPAFRRSWECALAASGWWDPVH
jgi:hypothetical protein